MIECRSTAELDRMREAGRLVAEVLSELSARVAPGVSTADLDALLSWVDPAAKPLVVQLPRDEYALQAKVWRLPDASLTNH